MSSNPRFYCPQKLSAGASVSLPPNAAVHAARVLRLQEGDSITLFNGDGALYTAKITLIRKSEVAAKVGAGTAPGNESPLQVTLLQGISSGDRMDFTIQKAVEMGVTAIQPIATQRSVVKLSGERADKRREHWQNVAIAACEQSGRAVIPPVALPLTLPQWLAEAVSAGTAEDARITLAPLASATLRDLPPPGGPITLLIGAEGGLSEDEIDLAQQHGFTGIRLGPRILRTETAALAALAAMQALWGDFLA